MGTAGARFGYHDRMTNKAREGLNAAMAAEFRAERAAQSMTVAGLVDASGIGKSQLLRILNEHREIDMHDLARLAHAFNLEPDELMRRAQDRLKQQ